VRIFTSRLHHDEEGVTLIIVVLCLVALFGMLVLVVDVGGLLLKRRQMVNGADAAALAAAKTCASQSDTSAPEAQADTYAISNVGSLNAGSGGIQTAPGCDSGQSGYVTVQYTSGQKLFFAPVLGAGSNGNVTTAATAAWGPLGGGNVVPIIIQAGTLHGPCQIPDPNYDPNTSPPKVCPLWYNNNDTLGSDDWGFLNLDAWGVQPGDSCPSAGASDQGDWILNDYGQARVLNGDPPGSAATYVCADGGHVTSNWQDLFTRMQTNSTLLFPVNDCTQQLDQQGNLNACVPGSTAPRTVGKYDIVGFVKLQLIQVLKGNDDKPTNVDGTPCAIDCGGVAAINGNCGNNTNLGTSGAGAYGLGGWSLDTIATTSCGAPKAPDTIANLTITKKVGPVTTTFVQCATPVSGCDYVYTDATHTIDWYNAATRPNAEQDTIKFDWTIDAVAPTPGICHPHTSDPNAICLQTQYKGFDTGGNIVGTGELFGAFGYLLCDRTLATCPDQT
jgi:Flp pilus assembly protein TadG